MKLKATEIVAALVEDQSSPFAKSEATLQYRPFQLDGDWKWYWVLLPSDRNKALASGQADSRAEAATAARLEARKLGILIASIDVIGAK